MDTSSCSPRPRSTYANLIKRRLRELDCEEPVLLCETVRQRFTTADDNADNPARSRVIRDGGGGMWFLLE